MEVDEDGQDPLSVAVQAANADIVTLYVKYSTLPLSFFQLYVKFTLSLSRSDYD